MARVNTDPALLVCLESKDGYRRPFDLCPSRQFAPTFAWLLNVLLFALLSDELHTPPLDPRDFTTQDVTLPQFLYLKLRGYSVPLLAKCLSNHHPVELSAWSQLTQQWCPCPSVKVLLALHVLNFFNSHSPLPLRPPTGPFRAPCLQ